MKLFNLRDLIVIIALILICASAGFLINAINFGEGNVAFVYYHRQLLMEIDLSAGEGVFSFPEAENVIIKTDSDGNIYFYYSDCLDKICINAGRLSRAGQSAACLPNGIIINIRAAAGRQEHDVILE